MIYTRRLNQVSAPSLLNRAAKKLMLESTALHLDLYMLWWYWLIFRVVYKRWCWNQVLYHCVYSDVLRGWILLLYHVICFGNLGSSYFQFGFFWVSFFWSGSNLICDVDCCDVIVAALQKPFAVSSIIWIWSWPFGFLTCPIWFVKLIAVISLLFLFKIFNKLFKTQKPTEPSHLNSVGLPMWIKPIAQYL